MSRRPAKPLPTFELRFAGTNIVPENIPVRSISDAIAAVQRMASGISEDEAPSPDSAVGLVTVLRGSARFACVAQQPSSAVSHLKKAGQLLSGTDDSASAFADAFLRPVRTLSDISRSLGCHIEVWQVSPRALLAEVDAGSYLKLSHRVLVSGTTAVFGRVMRVGGATGNRCLMRVPGRRKLLYCTVTTRHLSRRLGQCLYEEINATGEAQWVQRTWRLLEFSITDFTRVNGGTLRESISAIRDAGGKAWDSVDDPDQVLREIRG